MIEITQDNLNEIEKLNLHDSEIHEIKCLYHLHEVIIPLKLAWPVNAGIEVMLHFKNVHTLSVDMIESWGAGNYVAEAQYKDHDDSNNESLFRFVLLLNSGDKITLITDKIECREIV